MVDSAPAVLSGVGPVASPRPSFHLVVEYHHRHVDQVLEGAVKEVSAFLVVGARRGHFPVAGALADVIRLWQLAVRPARVVVLDAVDVDGGGVGAWKVLGIETVQTDGHYVLAEADPGINPDKGDVGILFVGSNDSGANVTPNGVAFEIDVDVNLS